MNVRITIALMVLLVVVVLGAILIAWPAPASTPKPTPTPAQPFTSENVIVEKPLPHAIVPKTFTVEGRARGTWFFEASFPLQVRDPENNPVGTGIAQTAENWMTTEFVPFAAVVTVSGYSGPARLILMKDNPSGLPENEDSVEFDITIE